MAIKKLEHEALGLVFEICERPTVRQHLEYRSAIAQSVGADMYVRHWEGVKRLIVDWQATYLPDYTVNLDEVDSVKGADTITIACNLVAAYMFSLDDADPN